MIQEAKILYKEESDFGVGGRPAIGYLRIVNYSANHASALALNFEGLYDSCLPDFERAAIELLESEEVIGVVFHRFLD